MPPFICWLEGGVCVFRGWTVSLGLCKCWVLRNFVLLYIDVDLMGVELIGLVIDVWLFMFSFIMY